MKFLKNKVVLFLLLVLAVLYFSSDFALIDIEKTAIIVAIAIDKENDDFSVTAQIAVPQSTDNASSNDDAVMTAEGSTVLEAINNIGKDTGWHPKLSFCSMIFISRELAQDDVEHVVDFFMSSEKVQNSAVIAMADDKASDLLLADTPLDSISSFALQKIVLKNEWMVSTVGVTNIKKFAYMNYSKAKTAYMPVIRIIKGKSKGGGNSSGLSPTAAQSGSGGEEGGKQKEEVIFSASEIALFKNGKFVGQLTDRETLCYYLLEGPVFEAYTSVDVGEDGYFLRLDASSFSVDVDVKKSTVKLSLDMKVVVADSTSGADLKNFNKKADVDKAVLDALVDSTQLTARSMFAKLQSIDADLFMIKDKIYKYHNSLYERFKDKPLSRYTLELNFSARPAD